MYYSGAVPEVVDKGRDTLVSPLKVMGVVLVPYMCVAMYGARVMNWTELQCVNTYTQTPHAHTLYNWLFSNEKILRKRQSKVLNFEECMFRSLGKFQIYRNLCANYKKFTCMLANNLLME